MTEDEAKNVRCPASVGRQYGTSPCIASECMAWRWMISPEMVPHLKDMWREGTSPDRHHEADDIEPSGYCGLAGRPE